MGFGRDTRGASIAVNHSLSIAITAILIGGLLIGAGGLLERQQEQVASEGLQSIGESLANEVTGIDRLSRNGISKDGTVRSTVEYPSTVAGTNYDMELLVRPDGTTLVYVNTTDPSVAIPVEFQNETEVCERELNGGPVRVVYDASQDCVTIESAGR